MPDMRSPRHPPQGTAFPNERNYPKNFPSEESYHNYRNYHPQTQHLPSTGPVQRAYIEVPDCYKSEPIRPRDRAVPPHNSYGESKYGPYPPTDAAYRHGYPPASSMPPPYARGMPPFAEDDASYTAPSHYQHQVPEGQRSSHPRGHSGSYRGRRKSKGSHRGSNPWDPNTRTAPTGPPQHASFEMTTIEGGRPRRNSTRSNRRSSEAGQAAVQMAPEPFPSYHEAHPSFQHHHDDLGSESNYLGYRRPGDPLTVPSLWVGQIPWEASELDIDDVFAKTTGYNGHSPLIPFNHPYHYPSSKFCFI
jgi:hypothetical protein